MMTSLFGRSGTQPIVLPCSAGQLNTLEIMDMQGKRPNLARPPPNSGQDAVSALPGFTMGHRHGFWLKKTPHTSILLPGGTFLTWIGKLFMNWTLSKMACARRHSSLPDDGNHQPDHTASADPFKSISRQESIHEERTQGNYFGGGNGRLRKRHFSFF
jgi:hypothetical protein